MGESHIIYSRAELATSPALAKFRFVSASGSKVKAATAGGVIYGVTMGAAEASTADDREVQVAMIGVASVENSSEGDLSKGALIAVGHDSRAKTATTAHIVVGIALSTAVKSQVFPILILPGGSPKSTAL